MLVDNDFSELYFFESWKRDFECFLIFPFSVFFPTILLYDVQSSGNRSRLYFLEFIDWRAIYYHILLFFIVYVILFLMADYTVCRPFTIYYSVSAVGQLYILYMRCILCCTRV